ncbi:hypothetical protein A2363_02915 [Candidatus Gottesmanbacteria bacterium RIFOXYB1_FULL_47_11]|uniref:Metallo-beta-lactamase domain-containing protein n=1 Tax=Candidatus Gottesmanbacteria bacterium RIFOXYB1_FULL_47_11 TaxID=1798401 RepID=A0A1F6BCD4_9BACT|nr:MAG: hypothetical protein A2363_02915 [Candidatus Gottesmanbacteria bacterium RIFOXYB1_FULL_47_11]
MLLVSFITSLPDGKLHLYFCNVGQGDAAYVRFPDGRDMLVDGGPNDRVIDCLSRYMPFWDREIDLVIMSHPQKDHIAGLVSVLARYRVGYVVRSSATEQSDTYEKLKNVIKDKAVGVKVVSLGEHITVGPVVLSVLGPGDATGDVNLQSLVFALNYGTFDALFPGDAPLRQSFVGQAVGTLEVLKVSHHGSRTGLVPSILELVHPAVAVISVGNNSFGHPSPEVVTILQKIGSTIYRTDKEGDIEVVSDGKSWQVAK